jgi:hypothetical protein
VKWLLLFVALNANAADPRYCPGPIPRNADGSIKRSSKAIAEFRKDHPCPSTALVSGPCPYWAIDHVLPISEGGCDAEINMQWLPLVIKSCAGALCKDRWERKVYAQPPALPLALPTASVVGPTASNPPPTTSQ